MGKFSDVLLTVDYDRTLTAPDSSIPERNLEAIRYFMENGGAFTVNTGRSMPMTQVFRGRVPVNAPLLLYNGSAAYDLAAGKLHKFKYSYEEDRESIEMLLADIEDPQQTMEAIISKILDTNDPDFGGITTWDAFREKVNELSQRTQNGGRGPGRASGSNEISVLSWRKFKRIINKATKNDDMFANRADFSKGECRLADALKHISPNDVCVVDIAKLPEDKQAFVFGDAVRTIYDLKLGEYDGEDGVQPPTRIVVFIDELNKYASKDAPKSSPILREILDVAERGRSLGVVLFGAEQSRSNIHQRVTGNCSTHAYGRTNSIETATKEYSSLPATYKNMLTRLEQGDYLIQNPIFRSLLKIRFPKPIYKQFK